MPNRSGAQIVYRMLAFVGFVCVWQVLSYQVDSDLLPEPWQVMITLYEQLVSGQLLHHLLITLRRVFVSFSIALSIGFFLGLLMGMDKRINLLFDGVMTMALNIPALVTIILCFVWFGLTEVAAILAVVLNKVPVVVVMIREGVKSVDQELMKVAQVYQIPKVRRFWKVFMPQIYPYLLAAIRSGLSLIWKIVLVVELLGCSDGVGFELGIAFQYFDINRILAYTFAFVIVMLAIEWCLVQPWERRISRWRGA